MRIQRSRRRRIRDQRWLARLQHRRRNAQDVRRGVLSIYVLNLRGNQRTAGELSPQGGRQGLRRWQPRHRRYHRCLSRTRPRRAGNHSLHDIGDYLTRDEKLARLAARGTAWTRARLTITPNEHGDWLNQRRDDFDEFMAVAEPDGSRSSSSCTRSALDQPRRVGLRLKREQSRRQCQAIEAQHRRRSVQREPWSESTTIVERPEA